MKEHFWDEIGNHSSKELLEKYFPGKVYENAAIQKNAVEFCQIAEKIVGLNKTKIPFLVESQLSSMPETYHDPGRKIIGKKYITDADASKAGACQKCLEHANRIFKWPQEAHLMPKLPLHPNCKCHYEDVYETIRKISSWDPEKIIMPQMTPEQWDSQNESDKKKWCRLFSSKFGFYISTYAQISNVPKSLLSVIVANELMDWRNIDGTQLDGLKGGGVGYAQIAIDTALQEGVSGYEKELVKKMKNNKFVPDYISYRIISGKVHKELLSTRGSIKIAAGLLRKYIEYYEIKVKNNDLGKGFQKTGLFFIKKRSIFDLDAQIADMQVPEPAFRIFCAIWNSGKEILDAKDKISESNYKNAYIHAENSLLAIEYLKELLSHEN